MERINPWPLFRGGKEEQEQGLRLVKQTYSEQPNASAAMTLGVALLWLRKYDDAWAHFQSVIESNPAMSGDAYFGMAGVAKWCLGKTGEAVQEWRAGLKAKYARAAGLGVRMPLLLFFTAVRQPKAFDRKEAEMLLKESTKDTRIESWPGPIASLILDQIGEAEFENHCRGIKPGDPIKKNPFLRNSPQQERNCRWLAEFYKSTLAYGAGGAPSDFKNAMAKLSDTSQPEWQDDKYVFTARIWAEEFFLARHEAAAA